MVGSSGWWSLDRTTSVFESKTDESAIYIDSGSGQVMHRGTQVDHNMGPLADRSSGGNHNKFIVSAM